MPEQDNLNGTSQDAEEKQEELSNFSLDILQIIKEAQAQHGLRHGDYQRYHGYCNRRIRRLRKVLGFKIGDKKRVNPKPINESVLTDSRFLLLLVMPTERAWSFAMKLKLDVGNNPRKKHHMTQRLKKAAALSTQLNTLCDVSMRVDARTKLEAKAYAAYMNGIYCFECQDWTKAMELFNTVKTIYGKLCETMSKEDKVVYQQMIEDVSPNIRYCAYNIGDQTAIDDLLQIRATGKQDVLLADKLDSLVIQAREQKASSMGEVSWKKHLVPVKNSKIRLFLISLRAFDKEITTEKTRLEKLDMYDNILAECKDALQCTADDIALNKNAEVGAVSDLDLLHSYINYVCIVKTIQRNLMRAENLESQSPRFSYSRRREGKPDKSPISSSKERESSQNQKKVKHSDFIHLYDIMLQNILDIPLLKGLSEDEELKGAIFTQEQAFRALKCFYIAEAYVEQKKWKEAMALYEQVLMYAGKAMEEMENSSNAEENFISRFQLESLTETIALNKYHVHASAVMQASEPQTKDDQVEKEKKVLDGSCYLMDHLDFYFPEDQVVETSGNVKKNGIAQRMTSNFPPPFMPVPSKPLFFDLALNHVAFPTLEDKLASKAKGGQGISGYIKSFWGWGGKKT